MDDAKRITYENVDLDDERELDAFMDSVFATGLERVRAEGERLRREGKLDAEGRLL